VTPRQARVLLEHFLDEAGWVFCRRTSLLIDALIAREAAA
jgi:hypothetical protein